MGIGERTARDRRARASRKPQGEEKEEKRSKPQEEEKEEIGSSKRKKRREEEKEERGGNERKRREEEEEGLSSSGCKGKRKGFSKDEKLIVEFLKTHFNSPVPNLEGMRRVFGHGSQPKRHL